MKKMLPRYLSVFIVLLISACATTLTRDIEIETQGSPHFSLGDYQSYAWVAAAQIVNDPYGQWEPPRFDADAEIRFLIDSQLRSHGLSEVDRNAGLLVAYLAGVDMMALELQEDPKNEIEILKNTPKGALLLLLVDRVSAKAVWAGVSVANMKEKRSAVESKKRLNYAVAQMFRRMPK